MKNSRNKAIALLTLVSVAFASFAGCSDKDDSSAVSLTEDQIRTPFQYETGKGSADTTDDPYNLNGQDPTEGDSKEPVTEYQPVTDDEGEPVTTYVVVTDDNGTEVTDTDGSTVTTAETVTTIVEKDPEVTEGDDYVPYTDRAYALWLDISKGDEGFYFEDSFIKVTFKVKEDIPDGVYDVKIADPDFSSIMGQPVYPDNVYHGKVFVSTEPDDEEPDLSNETGLAVSGDYISCKQGDEITFCFNIKNNPGLAAMCFWFSYDANAMEVINCEPDGEFADIAYNTQTGTANKNK